MKKILMNKNFVNIFCSIVAIICILFCLTGCTSADTVSYNLSREADEFKVKRRIVFINLRSDTYLFSITGNCSINTDTTDEQLEVVCRIGEDKYQKHFLRLSNETTYTVEQLEYSDVSRYDYEIVFRPEAIVPVEIKTQMGEK